VDSEEIAPWDVPASAACSACGRGPQEAILIPTGTRGFVCKDCFLVAHEHYMSLPTDPESSARRAARVPRPAES
jgi:hypothetical protein